MIAFLKKNILLTAIASGTAMGLLLPQVGSFLYSLGLISPMIALVFFCQGAVIDISQSKGGRSFIKVLIWGTLINQILAPLLAYAGLDWLPWMADEKLGFILIAVMPPTLVSGVILTRFAYGDVPVALSLTIILNMASVLTIPFHLNWMLGTSIVIDTTALLMKLLYTILLPACAGALWRTLKPASVKRWPRALYFTPIIALATTIFMSAAAQSEAIKGLSLSQVLWYAGAGGLLHVILFFCVYTGAALLNIAETSQRALAFCCSQKTLPVTIAIWSIYFSDDYPLALLPPIIFHFSQIYIDSFIAGRWHKRENLEA